MVKRGRAILFYLLVSLAVLSAAQWFRAQFVHEWFRWLALAPVQRGPAVPRRAHARAIELNGSGIAYRSFDCSLRDSEQTGYAHLAATPYQVMWQEATLGWQRLWFAWGRDVVGNEQVAIPYWAFFAPAIIAISLRRYLRRRRARRENLNLCPDCGYDLRATPDRCPECGREISREITRASTVS